MSNLITKTIQNSYNNNLHSLREEVDNNSNDILSKNKVKKINEELSKQEDSLIKNRPILSSSNLKKSNEGIEYRKSFENYIRKGIIDQNLSLTQNSDSTGYIIPEIVQSLITERLNINSPIRNFASVSIVSSDNLDLPAFNQEAIYEWGDGTTVAPVSDIFQKKILKINNITAQPKATQKMLDDSFIDIESWIAEILSDSFSEAENAAFINGDGVNKPTGILSYPTTGSDSIERITNANATKVTFDSILKLQTSLNSRYEKNGENVFLVSKNVLSDIRTMQDAAGRYIWDGIFEDSQTTLLGIPMVIVNTMKNITSKADVMIYGNLRKGYQIADRANINIMRDPFSVKPYVVFYTTKRVGGDVKDSQALKVLRMA